MMITLFAIQQGRANGRNRCETQNTANNDVGGVWVLRG